MLRLLTRFVIVTALAIPSQWYAIKRIRKDVFRRVERSPRNTFRSFAFLAASNFILQFVNVFGPMILGPEFTGRQLLAVAYHSFVVLFIGLSVFLLGLQLFNRLLVSFGQTQDRGEQAPQLVGREVDGLRDVGDGGHEQDPWACTKSQPKDPEPGPRAVGQAAGAGLMGRTDHISRRSFLTWASVAGMAASSGAMTYGLREGYQSPVINEFEISHKSLDGLRKPITLVQATDLHFGWFWGAAELERLVALLNSIQADAVLLTGDIFHSKYTAVESSEPIMKKLIPRRYGNFVVMGNHELYVGADRSLKSFRRSGLSHLGDRWISLQGEGAVVHMGGVDDLLADWVPTPQSRTFSRFMDKSPGGAGMRVLLCHRPSVLPIASHAGIDLVLAGHTHGGQMIIPWPGRSKGLSPAGIVSDYTHGWYRKFRCTMYLNRGAGLAYVPWRINCPPEIGVFHLVSSSREKRSQPVPGVTRIGDSW